MVQFNIRGVLAPVFTPIDDRGRINPGMVPEYVQHLNKYGVPGILVGGTTGEAMCLSLEERKEMLKAWVTEAKPSGIKVIAQVGGVPLPDVLAMIGEDIPENFSKSNRKYIAIGILAAYAQEIGADCLMTLPELYFKPRTAERLVWYLELVSSAAPDLPLLYYHFPMMSGVDVNISEFFALASSRIPTFKGMKSDLGVAVQVQGQLAEDQRIFIANHLLAPAALLGHVSSIATVTNMFPALAQELLDSTSSGDVLRAQSLQERMNLLVAGIAAQGDFVPSMKAAMELTTGIRVGPPRQPQVPLNQTQWTRVADHLRLAGIHILNSE